MCQVETWVWVLGWTGEYVGLGEMVKRVSVFTLVVGYLAVGRAGVAAMEVEGVLSFMW